MCPSEHPSPGTLASRPGLEKGHGFPGTPVRRVREALTGRESPRPGQPGPPVHLRTLRVAVGAGCGNSPVYLTQGTLLGRHLKEATVATLPWCPCPLSVSREWLSFAMGPHPAWLVSWPHPGEAEGAELLVVCAQGTGAGGPP